MPSYGVVPSASSPGASITTASLIPPVSGNGGAELPLAELDGKTMVDQASYSPLNVKRFVLTNPISQFR